MQKLTKIKIAGTEYPVKLDINVLEEIQENYSSISQFEREIRGIKEIQYNTKGEVEKIVFGEPSIKAVKLVLPLMINEGLKITADLENKEFHPVEAEVIYRNCDVSFEVLAKMIEVEFKKCFAVKK